MVRSIRILRQRPLVRTWPRVGSRLRGRLRPSAAGLTTRQIVVIWRETEGWQKADMERDKKFVAEQKLTEDADEIFVNGDSFIPNAKALEPVFKARMFDGVES